MRRIYEERREPWKMFEKLRNPCARGKLRVWLRRHRRAAAVVNTIRHARVRAARAASPRERTRQIDFLLSL